MPDPLEIAKGLVIAAAAAAAVLIGCAQPWRTACGVRTGIGGVLGIAVGFYAACAYLQWLPSWSRGEVEGRWLFVLFPAVVIVELIAAVMPARLGTAARTIGPWVLRGLVAAAATPILLYKTTYLAELAGPGTREWTPAQSAAILTALAAALIGVWFGLWLLVQRAPGRSISSSMVLACGAAGVTVMLSGYGTGGQLGLPLAAALAGVVAASLTMRSPFFAEGVVGPAVVGLFTIVAIGLFFGQLSRLHAALLFFGPLCGWILELPALRRFPALVRGFSRVALTAVPLAVALVLAQQKFAADSAAAGSGAKQSAPEDYLNFGG